MLAFPIAVQGATFVWDGGGGDDNWSTAANWDVDPTPFDDTDDLQFDGSTRLTPNVDVASTVNSITFNAGADSFTIGGSTITLDGTTPSITQSDDSAQTISTNIALGADTSLDGNGTGTLTLSGIISDSGGARALTKSGSSTVILSGDNTYSGNTTISAGTLEIQNVDALGEATVDTVGSLTTVQSGATLALNTPGTGLNIYDNLDIAGSGNGGAGAIHVKDGAWLLKGDLNLSADATIEFDPAGGSVNRFSMDGNITGSGGFTLNGWLSWTTIQKAGNTYTGVTILDGGSRLQLNHSDGLGSTLGGTIVKGNSTLSVINGSVVTGEELTLGDNSDSTGGTLRSYSEAEWAGNIIVDYDSTIDMTNSDANKQFLISGDIDILNSSTLELDNASTVDTRVLVVSGDITDSSGIGAILKNGDERVVMSGDNSYSGATSISAGVLEIQHENALGESTVDTANTTTTVSNGASLRFNNSGTYNVYENLVLNGVGDASAGALDVDDGSWEVHGTVSLATDSTIDVAANKDLTLSGVISGAAGLTKSGSGDLTLSGTNTYTGDTTVNGGSLLLGSSNVIADASDLILAGGTFSTGGFDETMSNLTLTADSVIDFGDGDSVLEFTGTVNTATHVLSIWNWNGDPWGGGGADQLIFSGDVSAVDFDNIIFYRDQGATLWSSSTGVNGSYLNTSDEVLPAVPEPSTWLGGFLLLASAVGGESIRRRKKAAKQSAYDQESLTEPA